MAISPELAKIYMMNPHQQYYVEGLSIKHAALPDVLHITNASVGFDGLVGGGVAARFEPLPFQITLPDKDTSGSQSMNVSISNVEQGFINDIETMVRMPYESASINYRVYIIGQGNSAGALTQQMVPAPQYDITRIVVNEQSITFAATKRNLHNRRFPRVQYRADEFPGLDR